MLVFFINLFRNDQILTITYFYFYIFYIIICLFKKYSLQYFIPFKIICFSRFLESRDETCRTSTTIFHIFPFISISITLGQHFITCRFSIVMQPSRLCHCFRIYTYIYTSRDRVDGSYIYISNPAIAFPGNFPQWSRWTGKVSTVRTDNAGCCSIEKARQHRSILLRRIRNCRKCFRISERSEIIRGNRNPGKFQVFFFLLVLKVKFPMRWFEFV